MLKVKSKLFFSLLVICLYSCSNKESVKRPKKVSNFEVSLEFPDTVVVNNAYSGVIKYRNSLDTITTNLYEVKKFRFIRYAYTGTKTLDYSDEHLKTIFKDTAYADDNRYIPLKNISFENVGVFYFDGIITDEVSIEDWGKSKEGEMMTRIITNEWRLTKKVVVIRESDQIKKIKEIKVI